VRSRLWRSGKLDEENFPFERISDYLGQNGCLVWVDLCDADSEDLAALAQELTLDPLAVEDAVGHAERAKATRCATHTFLTAYAVATSGNEDQPRDPRPDVSESCLSITRVSAFVLRRGIVTVRSVQEFDIDQVVQRWQTTLTCSSTGPARWSTACSTTSWTAISRLCNFSTTRSNRWRTRCSTMRR